MKTQIKKFNLQLRYRRDAPSLVDRERRPPLLVSNTLRVFRVAIFEFLAIIMARKKV